MTEPGGELEDDDGLRWYVVAVLVLAVVAGFAVTVLQIIDWSTTCSAKGMEVTTARDSLRGRLCQDAGGSAWLAIPLAWLAGSVLAGVALVRWSGGVVGTLLLVVVLATPSLLPVAAHAALSRSSTSCSDEELAAYRTWVDSGADGKPPHDCRTF